MKSAIQRCLPAALVLLIPPRDIGAQPPRPEHPAQTAQTGQAEGEITGTVVDSVTGRPVSRALVTSVDRRLATMTDSAGRFTFHVLPGRRNTDSAFASQTPSVSSLEILFTAQRPGYLPPDQATPVTLGTDTVDVQISLVPAASIGGQVLGDDGAPASGLTVLLIAPSVIDGQHRWAVNGAQRLGADGTFLFGDLRAGAYTLMTQEWSGSQPLPAMESHLTEQYPPSFLGGGSTLSGATFLPVHPGEILHADLSPRRAPYFPVSLPVAGAPSNVSVQIEGSGDISAFSLGFNQRTHTVEGALPNGNYKLQLRSFGNSILYGRADLHVTGAPVHAAPVALTGPVPILVHVRRNWTTHPPDEALSVSVDLMPASRNSPSFHGALTSANQDEILLPETAPGPYMVAANSSHGYIASLRCGAADLTVEPLTVTPAGVPCPIEMTLRDDTGIIQGTVEGLTDPAQHLAANGCTVFLLSSHSNGQPLQSSVTPDGSFSFPSVAPGSYTLFAAPHFPENFAWRDPATLQRLASRGAAVTLGAGGTLQVTVPFSEASLFNDAGSTDLPVAEVP